MLRVGARLAGTGALAGGGYVTFLCQTDEGSRRALTAYAAFLPVVAHYRFVEAKHKVLAPSAAEASSEFRALDARYAVPTVAKLAELQGMYCKYGQTCAGFSNTLSEAWLVELRKLEDAVPPRPLEVVLRTVVEETGRPVEETFASFDAEPLGSASIGQVHRATLRDGREVAVKVQYPDSWRLFRKDMAAIRGFFRIAAPENLYMCDALEAQNVLELDYTHEAAALAAVGDNMVAHKLAPREVAVPRPVPQLCTRRLLVMDRLPGPKLVDGLRAYGRAIAAKRGTTLESMEEEMRAKIDAGDIPAKYGGPGPLAVALYRRCAGAARRGPG